MNEPAKISITDTFEDEGIIHKRASSHDCSTIARRANDKIRSIIGNDKEAEKIMAESVYYYENGDYSNALQNFSWCLNKYPQLNECLFYFIRICNQVLNIPLLHEEKLYKDKFDRYLKTPKWRRGLRSKPEFKVRCKWCGRYTSYVHPDKPTFGFSLSIFGENNCGNCGRMYPMPSWGWDSPDGRAYSYYRMSFGNEINDMEFYSEFEKDYNPNPKVNICGDADAQFNLGLKYYSGDGVHRNYTRAFEWFQKASDQGYAPAQFHLGRMYSNGEGVPKDLVNAVELIQKAANQGFAEAQFNLGVMCNNGDGVPKNLIKAIKWLQKAAEQGFATAQDILGLMYFDGADFPRDFVKGLERYQKAADQGFAETQSNLDLMYAKVWGTVQYTFGLCLKNKGVPEDSVKANDMFQVALESFQKLAKRGDIQSQYNLGIMYRDGNGVPKDLVFAYAWFNLSTTQSGEVQEGAKKARDDLKAQLTLAELAEAQALSSSWRIGEILKRTSK